MFIWLLAVAFTAVLVEAARRFAPVIGLVDVPSDRKPHKGEIPLVGGIAIFFGLIFTLPIFGAVQDHWAFLVAAAVLVAVGIWDDVKGIRPVVRLLFQGGAVIFIAYFGDAMLIDLGAVLPGETVLSLGWLAMPFTVFAGIGLINAFNMTDGVDGLCGTLTLIALAGLGTMAAIADNHNAVVLAAMLTAGVVGFLVYNLRVPGRDHAKVFLGDAGSYLLGLSLFYLTIRLSQEPNRAMAPVSALWFCMLPLFDTIGMILRRIKRGQSPFSADREHLHHVFLLAKFSVTETWAGMTVVALIGLGVGLAASVSQVSEFTMMAAFVGASIFYYWMIKRAWRLMRFLSRSINRRTAAKVDRRHVSDRRDISEIYYIDGIPVERRSGAERRDKSDDRRIIPDEIAAEEVTLVAAQQVSGKSDNNAAQ